MKFQKHLFSNQGMSLIGVLTSLGILSILVVGVMTVANNMMQASRAADVKLALHEEMLIAQALLATESNCTVNFKGLSIGEKSQKFKPRDGKLFLSTEPGVYKVGKTVVFPSQTSKTSSVILKGISYRLYPDSKNVMLLSLDFEPRGNILGGSLRERELPLQVSLKNDKIESCVALGTPLPPSLPDDEDDDDYTNLGQGQACSGPPAGSRFTKNDMKKTLEKLCDLQDYPVKKGLKIPAGTVGPGGFGCKSGMGNCAALWALQASRIAEDPDAINWEFGSDGDRTSYVPSLYGGYQRKLGKEDTYLTSRNGYKNKEECLKQKSFSEGDSFVHPDTGITGLRTCVNGRWTL